MNPCRRLHRAPRQSPAPLSLPVPPPIVPQTPLHPTRHAQPPHRGRGRRGRRASNGTILAKPPPPRTTWLPARPGSGQLREMQKPLTKEERQIACLPLAIPPAPPHGARAPRHTRPEPELLSPDRKG